jgi:light-regulated signal transduction histidine kinase (bacteriophytochrome)
MKRMIAAMLVLSRVSQQHLALTSVNLGKKVHQVLQQLQAEYPAEQIEFELLNDAAICADNELLHLLLHNLLENAVKFSRGQNPIRISIDAQPQDGMVLISVRDNGVGFDMRYADKLFAPLQRLHSQQEFPGMGIGLATAQRIVHRLGGKIWAESEPGNGAAFFFTLPACEQEQAVYEERL